MSIIVVSDVHIGNEISNYEDFSKFIDWIARLDRGLDRDGGTSIIVRGEAKYEKEITKEIKLTFPEKIILLGDILELWDPKDGSIEYTVRDAFIPFWKLVLLKCEKIFVIGDHEKGILDCLNKVKKLKHDLETTSTKSSFNNNSNFRIIEGFYPPNIFEGLKIGSLSFVFFHGHQFDKALITKYFRKKWGIWFDPFDVVWNISNFSIVKPIFKEKKETIIYYSLLVLLLGWDYVQRWLFSLVTLVQTPQFLITILSGLLTLTWAILVSYVVLTPSVKVIAKLQGYIWNKFLKAKPKDKTIKEVIEEGYYQESSDNMHVDVVVFGHTHIADSSYLDFNNRLSHKSKNKLFVNTGAWVKESDGRKLNTFAYIDNNGIEVLSWTGKKEDDKYVFEHVCTHTADSLKSVKL